MSRRYEDVAICKPCWYKLNPGRRPARLKAVEAEPCCECQVLTRSGIYVRRLAS